MQKTKCNRVGCPMLRVRPIIIRNGEVIIPDDSEDIWVWFCPFPECTHKNF